MINTSNFPLCSVASLRREANGLGPLEIDRGDPHVIYSRANPMRNPVTD